MISPIKNDCDLYKAGTPENMGALYIFLTKYILGFSSEVRDY
jgi:hypothetical protein